jgi:hypothetical protein
MMVAKVPLQLPGGDSRGVLERFDDLGQIVELLRRIKRKILSDEQG